MRNITIIVEDEVYTRARVWAAEHNTSVSAVVQYMLSTLRTNWRARNFLAALAANPEVRKPIAPFRSPRSVAPSPASAFGQGPSELEAPTPSPQPGPLYCPAPTPELDELPQGVFSPDVRHPT